MPQFESMPILERNSLYNKMWTLRGNAFLVEVLQEAKEEKFRYYPDYRSFSPKHIKRQCRATIVSSYDSSDDKVCLLIFLLVWDQQSGTVRFKLREGGINVKGRRKDWMDGAEMYIVCSIILVVLCDFYRTRLKIVVCPVLNCTVGD